MRVGNKKTTQESDTTRLSPDAWTALEAAMCKPAKANAALKELMK